MTAAPLPDAARYAMDAARAIGATFEDLDHGGGYLFRVSRGGRSVLAGAFGVCSYPVNGATAYTIARDKSHTKSVLRAANIPVIEGGLFFAHQRRVALRGPGREVADAIAFAARLGFPVFCKPNTGGRGNLAEIIASPADLEDYARRIASDFESFLVERLIEGDEHRIFVQAGRATYHSTKSPPILIGDGRSTARALLSASNALLAGSGVSPTPESVLHQAGISPDAIPAAGARIALPGRRNLSAEGGVEHVSLTPPHPLANIALAATSVIGLDIAAVDLFDISTKRDLSDLVVIEVNGNPGLRTLELAGRTDVIRRIWTDMLETLLAR
jgi:cyanophycin synthetase